MLKYPVLPLKQHGFTLIELMVTVSILAVIAMIAAPSFTPLIERWRVRGAAEELQSTIYYARSEAIKRGGGVTINATDNADWANGWEVHGIDADGDAERCKPAAHPPAWPSAKKAMPPNWHWTAGAPSPRSPIFC